MSWQKNTNRQESRKRSKWSDYKSLVAAICDGKEPSADVFAQTLADNERTLDGLRHDVLLIIRRHALVPQIESSVTDAECVGFASFRGENW